jgi:hypothetical protein
VAHWRSDTANDTGRDIIELFDSTLQRLPAPKSISTYLLDESLTRHIEQWIDEGDLPTAHRAIGKESRYKIPDSIKDDSR